MALSLHKYYSDKSLFNAILLQLYGRELTIESHNLQSEGATLWTN